MMDCEQFEEIVAELLAPLLGARVGETLESSAKDGLASYVSPVRIAVKIAKEADYKVVVERSQKFEVSDKKLAELFARRLADLDSFRTSSYFEELLKGLPRRLVAEFLSDEPFVQKALECLESWSARTYEGHRITASFGIQRAEPSAEDAVLAQNLWEQEFAPVLSNGYDTLLKLSESGRVLGFEQLDYSEQPPPSFAPYRLGRLASWASADSRLSLVLNIHGEILVFSSEALIFAKREGRWEHYIHDAIIKTMSQPQDVDLRTAIYESCMDVSFARSGGCIGVLSADGSSRLSEFLAEKDRLSEKGYVKTKLFSDALESSFKEIDRRFRQEMLSLDGAVVLDHTGHVVAVGAIVDVPAGSSGGGRLAAAMKLSEYGLGIKISADGGLKGFRKGEEIFSQ